MRRLCAGQVFEAPKAHRSKNLDEVVRPAHRGVEPRRLRYDQRRDTNRGPKKCAGCSPDLIDVLDNEVQRAAVCSSECELIMRWRRRPMEATLKLFSELSMETLNG